MSPQTLPECFRLGDWLVDTRNGELRRVGTDERQPLPGLSLALLLALARRAGELVDSDTLIAEVWQGRSIGDDTLQQRVKLLRRALRDDPEAPVYIATVRGRGYRLLPHPAALPPSPPPGAAPGRPGRPRLARQRLWLAGLSLLLLCLALASLRPWHGSPSAPAANPRRLAVLPLHLLSEQARDRYFADGLAEQLIQDLSRQRDLEVIAYSSVRAYRDHPPPLPEVARELAVGHVLEGSVHSDGTARELRLNLVRTSDGTTIWSQNYPLQSDALDVQKRVAQAVAQALESRWARQDDPPLPANGTAYELYLEGRERYWRYTAADNRAAIALFRASLAKDPAYALALAGLSDAYGQAVFQFDAPESDAREALRFADAALALAPNLAEAHKARAFALEQLGRVSEAAKSYERALQQNPGFADALINLAALRWESGQLAKAFVLAEQAARLDPLEPFAPLLAAQILAAVGLDAAAQRRFGLVEQHHGRRPIVALVLAQDALRRGEWRVALSRCSKLLSESPDYLPAQVLAGDAARLSGDKARAMAHYRAAAAGQGADAFNGRLRLALDGQDGDPGWLTQAEAELRAERDAKPEAAAAPVLLALIAAWRGDAAQARRALQTAIARGWRDSQQLAQEPLWQGAEFAPLRDRLQAMLRTEKARIEQGGAKAP